MRCDELIKELEHLAPLNCACDWDNVGLLAGRCNKEVKKVFLAVDATDEIIEEAILWGADMLITHHPLIFKPLKKISDTDFIGRRVLKLIANDISCYAMHTNFDSAPGCMADAAAKKLDLTGTNILELEGTLGENAYGIGRTGFLKKKMTIRELAGFVKERFALPFVTIYGESALEGAVDFVAISPGSGESMIAPALEAGAQVLITGDIGHHSGIDAAASHMAVIDAGHYGLEYLFLDFMENYLKNQVTSLTIKKAGVLFPQTLI